MQTISWSFPLPRTHAGIAMGNGLLGALIWGNDRINITLNRADFWDHRGAYQPTEGITTYARTKEAYTPEDSAWVAKVFPQQPKPPFVSSPSRLPFGRFELELRPGHVPVTGELDLATGAVTIRVAAGGRKRGSAIRFDLSVEQSVLCVEDPDRVIRRVKVRPAWDWLRDRLQAVGFRKPLDVTRPNLRGWVMECPADPALAAVCRRSLNGYAIALDRAPEAAGAVDAAVRLSAGITAARRLAIRKANAAWWRAYWKRAPRLQVPDDFFNRFYLYALYKFGAATNPRCPWPAALQGPWIEEYQWPSWHGDYHFNVNVQQVYTLACAANQPEHLMPLLDRLDSWRDVMRRNAKVVCGIEDGLILGMCVDDRGEMLGAGPGVLMDHACSGWTAQLFWLYYQHTGDLAFLRDRAYPFMQGVMRVYEEMLERRNGRLSIPVCISAEYGNDIAPRSMGRDPSWQLACIHMLADALLEAARLLKTPPRPIWRTIKEDLPPYTLIGKSGDEHIAIWEGQDLDQCHRHHSHLACLYPFDTLGEPTPETQRIVDNTIDHWISRGMGKWSEWCMPWAAIIQARLGFKDAPWLLLRIWKDLFINEGLATVYLPRFRGITVHRAADQKKPRETNEIMQLDGTLSGVTALYEMLVHARGSVTRVFPAVPDDWRDVAFSDISLPGGFLVSAKRSRGALAFVRIKSRRGGALTLEVSGHATLHLARKRGQRVAIRLPARLTFQPGETVWLYPAAGPASPRRR